jgi:hypothetical protein
MVATHECGGPVPLENLNCRTPSVKSSRINVTENPGRRHSASGAVIFPVIVAVARSLKLWAARPGAIWIVRSLNAT